MKSQEKRPVVATATASRPPAQEAEDDDELIFVSAQPGKGNLYFGHIYRRGYFDTEICTFAQRLFVDIQVL